MFKKKKGQKPCSKPVTSSEKKTKEDSGCREKQEVKE